MTEKNTTPKVYAAIHKVLKALQVDKGGMLPGNMGGKAYMTAEDISNEVKRLFVANNLILQSNEEVVTDSVADLGDKKMRFQTTIKGTYTAIHIEDGSTMSFSGTGQGLATGTAVAANIASTFSLKNALLRTFLISESGVEQDGQTEQAPPKQSPAQQAVSAPPAVASVAPNSDNLQAQTRIAAKIADGTYDKERVTKLNQEIATELNKPKGEVLVELEKRLQAGGVA